VKCPRNVGVLRARRLSRDLATALLVSAGTARAQDLREELDVRADEVTVDVRMRELELRGHVHADAPPFHLSADALKLHRTSHGIIVDGDGRLTFCPCLGTPLALGFKSVTVAPPADLFMTSPRLEIFHVPVLWLPWFWLRAPSRVGLLPPEIAWRGADGLFLGEGVHLPWRTADGGQVTFDLRAGGYVYGGVAVDANVLTETTTTHVRFDRLAPQNGGIVTSLDQADGLLVDARGSLGRTLGPLQARGAWDFDMLRGIRGVYMTTELDPASRPFDVGSAEASLEASSFIVATGVRATALRGGDVLSVDAAGPYVTVAHDAALGHVGTYDATLDGSVVHETGMGSVALAHGEVGALVAGHASWIGLHASLRGVADAAADPSETGAMGAALARAEATLPLVRAFGELRHRIEPVVAVSALASDTTGTLADIAARSMAFLSQAALGTASGDAGIASAGLRTALARWARGDGIELEAHVGGLLDQTGAMRGMVRWRAVAGGTMVGLSGEGAHVFSSETGASGDAFVLRARVGVPERTNVGPSVTAYVAARDGVDPVAARLLTGAPLEPAVGLLALPGYTGGVRASVPWARWISTRGGVDMDLTSVVLTAATGSIELRDTCGCFRLRLNASHRLGRDGVDVWATIDLTR
jgi:hypothetical protein